MIESGAQSVMTPGVSLIRKWCAISSDLADVIMIRHNSIDSLYTMCLDKHHREYA